MANARHDRDVHWVAPLMRGILPLTAFHVPRRLRRTLRREPFEIRCDTSFASVIRICAEPRPGHPQTWINDAIIDVFERLHGLGHAHSVEAWQDDRLVGGLYGLALGGAFFGESMFSHRTDASKIALVHLVARLRLGGFSLLDVQFITDHLRQFGALEIPSASYIRKLGQAVGRPARFYLSALDGESAISGAVQSNTQTS
jgi:leucyl/phenylalanyl-tRNA--protein transferase